MNNPIITKHNTLAHIVEYIEQERKKNPTKFEPDKLGQFFENLTSNNVFPVGTKAYQHLLAIKRPQELLNLSDDATKIQYLSNISLDVLDPNREVRNWLDEQASALHHYLNRKVIHTNKAYWQLMLDSIFPEHKDDLDFYRKYEILFKQSYLDAFIMHASAIWAAGSVDIARTDYILKIAMRYQEYSHYIEMATVPQVWKNLEPAIKNLKIGGHDDLLQTRLFDNLKFNCFPIPLIEYEFVNKIKLNEAFLQLKEDMLTVSTNPEHEVDPRKLKDINFIDPEHIFRELLFSYLQQLDEFLYSKAEGDITHIRLIFNTLYPDEKNDDAKFAAVENTLRKAYFSGFAQTLITQSVEDRRDVVATVAVYCVNEMTKQEPVIKPAMQAKPTVTTSNESATVDEYAQKMRARTMFFDKLKQILNLDPNENYKTNIRLAYKALYQQHENEFVIHHLIREYVKQNYPQSYHDDCLYRFNNEWEKTFRKELMQSIGQAAGDPTAAKKFIDDQEQAVDKKHHAIAQKEFRKLARSLERFAGRVRLGNDGWYLDTKYHAIHDVSQRIEQELHAAYSKHRLLSPKEKQVLKQRCLGAVDDEMKFLLKKQIDKGVWYHVVKQYQKWREQLAKLLTPTSANDKENEDVMHDGASKRAGSTRTMYSTQSSHSSTSSLKNQQNTNETESSEPPAKSHELWNEFEKTLDKVSSTPKLRS